MVNLYSALKSTLARNNIDKINLLQFFLNRIYFVTKLLVPKKCCQSYFSVDSVPRIRMNITRTPGAPYPIVRYNFVTDLR